jgi:di/tricarboxylate transporter
LTVPEMLVALSVCLVLPLAALLTAYSFRRLASRERMHAIEKGVNIPFESVDPRERAARTRRWAIVLIALGIGWILFCLIGLAAEKDNDMLTAAGLGLIPALIGAGLLIDFRLRSKELDASEARSPAEPLPR